MMSSKVGKVMLAVLACLVLLPSLAAAQSQISGTVKDESGGVLPGVTVEAASPALIEKSKSTVSDANGRYQIVDLRQGTYKLTFTLAGFQTVVRDAVELSANFTATINADMKVGTLEETITVSGQTPLVDVQQAAKTQVITRDIIDSLPSTRNIMSMGNFVPGIRLGTPDIGGSRSMEQTNPRGHGLGTTHTVQQIDGMSVNSQETSNQQSYYDDALSAEVTVTTAAQTAEQQSGGMRVNAIPKDGGNIVSGSIFLGGEKHAWQSNNINAYLRAAPQNITSANGDVHIQNFNGSLGGPIKKDKVWFFIAARHISTDELVANTPPFLIAPNGEFVRSLLDQYIRDTLARATWQISQKNKLAAFFQRTWKRKGKDFTFGQDPRSGTQRDPHHGHYAIGDGKYTSTLTSKILLEAGYSTAYQHWTGFVQPQIDYSRYLADGSTINPLWFANGTRTDTALNINPLCAYSFGCTQWVSEGADQRTEDTRHYVAGAMSYVTGTHNIKFGVQDSFGPVHVYTDRQGDVTENYVNNKPSTVTVYSTPAFTSVHVNYDLGYYVQDSWTMKRLTLNPGLRVENFNSQIDPVALPAGRFVPARFFPAVTNVPNWNGDLAPRFSAAYDVFGDGKTAVKFGWSKYWEPQTGGFANRYAPGLQSESRTWFDCALNAAGNACSGVNLPTNGDGIAQDNEIGPSKSTSFGSLVANRTFDPSLKRQSNEETMVTISRQLSSMFSVSAGYYHRSFQNLTTTDRTNIRQSDYSSFNLATPDFSADPTIGSAISAGVPLTMYNLNPAKTSLFGTGLVDLNVPDQSIYNGLDVLVQGRLRGGTILGSWTTERNVSVFCSNQNDPNGPPIGDLYSGASVSNGGRFCDWRQFHIPFTNEFKASGSYPLPLAFEVGAVLQSYAGTARTITYTPGATLFPGGVRTNSEQIILNPPGTLYYPRYNQLDLNLRKNFRAGRKSYSLQMDVFNALNGSAITARNDVIGGSLGQVQVILVGRLMRLAFQMRF
ncbi:MAG TPA: carboxypeptidase regulatory-like domain-containing protein [Vicinamibacterales bacterium]|nr:carboxypeptidase regulatory-like domain-containing protein [Vicinamibacterales bacterium]